MHREHLHFYKIDLVMTTVFNKVLLLTKVSLYFQANYLLKNVRVRNGDRVRRQNRKAE